MISTRPPSLRPFLVALAALWTAPAVSALEHLDAGSPSPPRGDLPLRGVGRVGGETRSGVDAVGAVYNAEGGRGSLVALRLPWPGRSSVVSAGSWVLRGPGEPPWERSGRGRASRRAAPGPLGPA